MHVAMSSPWKKQPEDVVDSVLKRAEVSKVRSGIPTDPLSTPFRPHSHHHKLSRLAGTVRKAMVLLIISFFSSS